MKAKSTRSIKPEKTRHVGDEAFADLKEALEGALAFERGEPRDLRVTRIRAPRHPKKTLPKDSANIER